jgi:hypothetical protein
MCILNGNADNIAVFQRTNGNDGAMLQGISSFVVLGFFPIVTRAELVTGRANETSLIQN